MSRKLDTSLSGNARALVGLLAGIVVAFAVWITALVAADLASIRFGALPTIAFALVAYFAGAKTRQKIIGRIGAVQKNDTDEP